MQTIIIKIQRADNNTVTLDVMRMNIGSNGAEKFFFSLFSITNDPDIIRVLLDSARLFDGLGMK